MTGPPIVDRVERREVAFPRRSRRMMQRRARSVGAVVALVVVVGCRGDPASITRPSVPVIDIHTHLGGVDAWPGDRPNFAEIQRAMRDHNVDLVVDFKAPSNSVKDGVFQERVTQRLALYPDTSRFKLFANIPINDDRNLFLAEERSDYPIWVTGLLEDAVRRGASGLKIKMQAGSREGGAEHSYWVYDRAGMLIPFDTPAFDPLWETASRLRVPVLLHLSGGYKGDHQEPKGAWKQVRWEVLMLERERVLRRHPHLLMIGAHFGCAIGDESYLAEILERYPNLSIDAGAHDSSDAFAILDSTRQAFFERYQDQILFGTDYMENTFRYLKSYGQRLEMILPFTEAWPLADSVRAKYYNGNARRLLHRVNANSAPVANAGFTMTTVVGRRVTLDGSGSFDIDGDSLRYSWQQLDGPPVRLTTASSARPWFDAKVEGVYHFSLSISDGHAQGKPRTVMINVVDAADFFAEDSGRVVIEAEHASARIARSGQSWTNATATAGFSGEGYVVAGPDRGVSIDDRFHDRAPELRYKVWITTPGTYVASLRGMARDSTSNSVHVGLDNEEERLADRLGEFPVGRWSWVHDTREWDDQFKMIDQNLAVLNIAEAGPHILNIWMQRDGFMLDKIMLLHHDHSQVSFPIFEPGARPGPPESKRGPR
jgi:predicted TIM-barrel fold metal-dependent hydrolase